MKNKCRCGELKQTNSKVCRACFRKGKHGQLSRLDTLKK